MASRPGVGNRVLQFLLQSLGVDSSQGSGVSSLAGLFPAVLVHQNLLSGRGREHG